jgi:hypothetical protein
MLLGTFSKAEISTVVDSNKMNTSVNSFKISASNSVHSNLYNIGNSKKDRKKILTPFPKKPKKVVTQCIFEIRKLPKGEYTAASDYDNNILITKKTMILK